MKFTSHNTVLVLCTRMCVLSEGVRVGMQVSARVRVGVCVSMCMSTLMLGASPPMEQGGMSCITKVS